MGDVREPIPAKLICGYLGAAERFEKTAEALTEAFGPIDFRSEVIPFTQTTYYEKEMGAGLSRAWVSFERLVHPGDLAGIKLATNRLEAEFSDAEGRRTVNLDPGLLDEAKLVLASTKNFAHRVYIGQGIYAEVTLIYRQEAFRVLPWTYADHRENLGVFEEVRRLLREGRGGT